MSDAGPPQGAKAPLGGSAVHAVTSVGAISHPRDILLGAQAAAGLLPDAAHVAAVHAAAAAGAKPYLVLTGKGEATQASGELPPGTQVYPDLDAVAAALTA